MIRTRHFFRAHRSVTVALATASFSAALLCSGLLDTAAAAQSLDVAPDAAPGVITIGSSATSAAPGEGVFISVHRGEGTDGEVSVSVDSQQLPAELAAVIAPIHTRVTFLDGEGEDKEIPIVFLGDDQPVVPPVDQPVVPPVDQPVVPPVEIDPGLGGGGARAATSAALPGAVSRVIAAAEGSSAPLTVSLSAPTGGAQIGTPSSVTVSIAVPPTTTPVDGGSDAPNATTGDTTQPGTSSKNSSGTTVPVGGGKSLAASGVNALPQIVTAILVASAGLATLLFVRRRRSSDVN